MTKLILSDRVVTLLKKLAAGEKLEGFRSLVIEHEPWCPLMQRKGPCACNSVTHEATDEEWERLTSEKPEQDKDLEEWSKLIDGAIQKNGQSK